jgi:phosphatidylserine decarboxylase
MLQVMATVELPPLPSAPPTAPVSVQPGGGACVSLELAWGCLRRACLRRFRPNYVRRMAEKRQGHCPACPHDIIDPRDLKFYRNVCGYWFRDEDDHFAWRGRLGLARAGLAEVVCFSLLFGMVAVVVGLAGIFLHWGFWIALAAVVVLWFEVVYFFRDPHRVIPDDPCALVSPADGTVTHIGEVDDPDFPGGRAFRISFFLSVLSVHINRTPRTGRVTHVRYFPGCFRDARRADSVTCNEQLWIDIEEDQARRLVRVKQISGAIARRIVCWLKQGERVTAGDRLGMIKFGSRTDVLIPAGDAIALQVQVGDAVKGGASVLLRFREVVEGDRAAASR